MKNLFLGIIIIGILAAIAGVILMHMNRTEYWKMKVTADHDRAEAVDAKKIAETSADNAQKKQKEAEDKRDESYKVRDQAVEEKKQFEGRAQAAEKLRNEAESASRQDKDERDQALVAKKIADQEKSEADEKRKEADARAVEAELARDGAIAEQQKSLEIAESLRKDWENIKELTEQAKTIAAFVSNIANDILQSIDEAGQRLDKGCETSTEALATNDAKKKYLSSQLLQRSIKYYEASRAKLDKLKNFDKETAEEIKGKIRRGIDNYIACVQILSTLVKQMINNDQLAPDAINEKANLAIAKKSEADQTIIDVCNALIDLMRDNEDKFPPTIKKQLEDIKKKIAERISTESGASIDRKTEENTAVLPKK